MIDCDVHNDWASADVLLPYLAKPFREFFERGERSGGPGSFPHAHRPFVHPEGIMRTDLKSQVHPGASYDCLRSALLDRYGIEYAILGGEEGVQLSTLQNPYYASALARAHNEWMSETWLNYDPRLRGSVLVAPQDPEGAAIEIRRLADDRRFVQVLVSMGAQRPYGDRCYHPIWEAASEAGLPVAIHIGGYGGFCSTITGSGPPSFYWEAHALYPCTAMGHIASLIAQGVFEKWPNLVFVIVEAGIAWYPALLMRLDADFKATRKETPWLRRLPSEYARDHIRLTTQPLEHPASWRHYWDFLQEFGGKDVLLFASDYPHWDFDNPAYIENHLPPSWREAVLRDNARSVFTRLG